MPQPPVGKTAAVWDEGETSLLPSAGLPTLKHRAAVVAAECIDRAPEVRRRRVINIGLHGGKRGRFVLRCYCRRAPSDV